MSMTRFTQLASALLISLLCVGCTSGVAGVTKGVLDKIFEPGPTTLEATLSASDDINPDLDGRPSPLVVRVYELRNVSTFNRADFFKLYEQDSALLAADLLAHDEMRFRPGDSRPLTRELQPETRFIAILAAYRDIGNAAWRKHIELELHDENELKIRFDKLGIAIDRTGD